MRRNVRRTTLLDLLKTVQDQVRSDAEVVAVIAYLIDTGRLVLSGTFADPLTDAVAS